MRVYTITLVAVLVISMTLASCNSFSLLSTSILQPTETPEPTSTSTPTLTPSPSNTPTATNTPIPTPMTLSEDGLRSLALSLNDLQPGYTIDEDDTGLRTYDNLLAQDSKETASALQDRAIFPIYSVLFQRYGGPNTVLIYNLAIVFKDVASAREYLLEYVSFYLDLNLEPMSFASLGMESAAFSGHVEGNEGFIHHRVIIRQHNLIVELRMASVGGVGLEEFIQYSNLLSSRLTAIGSSE